MYIPFLKMWSGTSKVFFLAPAKINVKIWQKLPEVVANDDKENLVEAICLILEYNKEIKSSTLKIFFYAHFLATFWSKKRGLPQRIAPSK